MLRLRDKKAAAIVKLSGIWDATNFEALEAKLLDIHKEGFLYCVFDLEDVNYMSNTAWGILLGLHTSLQDADGEVSLLNINETLRNGLEAIGFDSIFWINSSLVQAMERLRGM